MLITCCILVCTLIVIVELYSSSLTTRHRDKSPVNLWLEYRSKQ